MVGDTAVDGREVLLMVRKPIKILHLLFQYPQFAGGCYFTEYLDCLAGEDFRSTLLTCRYPENVSVPKTKSLDIVWIKQIGTAKVAEFGYMIQLLKFLFDKRLKDIDIINCVGPRGLVFANVHRLLFRTKVMCTVEMVSVGAGVKNLLDRVICFCFFKFFSTDLVISWSRYHSEKYLGAWVTKDRLVTIPPGIREELRFSLRKARGIRRKYAGKADIFLTFVKPLHRPNGEAAIRIIRSIKVLKDKYGITCKLLLFKRNREQDAEVIREVEELGLGNHVKFLEFVKFSGAKDYINASDFIVLPYVYETTVSRSLLEAMQTGKLIITTIHGEVGHIIKDGKNGLITSGDPVDIARILFEVKNGKIKTEKLVKAAKEAAQEQFSQRKNIHLQAEKIRSLFKV